MTSPSPSPAVEPITCQSRCQERGGHPTERVREDQWCFGAEHRVELSTEPSVLMNNGETAPTYLTTCLLRQADDTAPRVFIGHDESPGEPATSNEARRFAVEILAQVDEHGI